MAWPLPFSVGVAPKAAKVAPPSELTLKITIPVGVTPALVTVAVSVILPPTVIVVADSSVVVVELHIFLTVHTGCEDQFSQHISTVNFNRTPADGKLPRNHNIGEAADDQI